MNRNTTRRRFSIGNPLRGVSPHVARMRRLPGLLACGFLLSTSWLFGAMPLEQTITHVSTPIQLGVNDTHYLYPKEYGVHGLRLNIYQVENRFMHGLDLGFWNRSGDAGGVQLALYRNETHDFGGIQAALWSAETGNFGGFQFAGVRTDAHDLRGIQLTGLLGKARSVGGIQAALLNAASESETGDSIVQGLQAALYETRAESLGGIQLGGVFSDVQGEARGGQAAILFAETQQHHGLQLGGATARAKHLSGLQLAGLMARSDISAKGLQCALILSQAGEMQGVQAGFVAKSVGQARGGQIGLLSTTAGSLRGVGLAGVWNFVYEDVRGGQAAIGYNRARRVRGIQFGLVNQCEQLHGVQIGLLNMVRERRTHIIPFIRIHRNGTTPEEANHAD